MHDFVMTLPPLYVMHDFVMTRCMTSFMMRKCWWRPGQGCNLGNGGGQTLAL